MRLVDAALACHTCSPHLIVFTWKGYATVSTMRHLLPLEQEKARSWQEYLLDSLLATAGSLLVTGMIALFQLYPRIPNISIVYLLVVLALATTRSLYAAIIASLIAFLSFDYFIVPPLYTFVIYRIEEWIALFVFLIDAILTGYLASALRQRAQQAARDARELARIELLQRTDALRAALLSSVSHDLRTPLTIIKAAASSLLEEDIQWSEEEKHSCALSIEREADRLNRLVGNLLDMSRIEEGALKPEKEWYQLTSLIQDVVDRLQPLLQGRIVDMHLSRDVPPVELDYLLIDQVLTNLLENAVRYTPPTSPIEINTQCRRGEVLIRVADRGPGIPPDDLERIFDKFYRVLSNKSAPYTEDHYPTGSGLGLAVCKGVVEAHGGRIWAEAREGGGAVFSITLPIGIPEGDLL